MMLACQLASAVAVVWGIRVRKGVVRYKTVHEDENPTAGHSSWAEQDRLLNPMRAGQDLPCCGVLAPVRCGGWDGVAGAMWRTSAPGNAAGTGGCAIAGRIPWATFPAL